MNQKAEGLAEKIVKESCSTAGEKKKQSLIIFPASIVLADG